VIFFLSIIAFLKRSLAENGVGLVAVLISMPRSFAVAAPRHTHRSVRVNRNVHVMSTPDPFCEPGPEVTSQGLPVRICCFASLEANADSNSHIAEDCLKYLAVVREVHFGRTLEFGIFSSDLPTFLSPKVERIEHDQTGVGSASLFKYSLVTSCRRSKNDPCSISSNRRVW